MTKEELAVMLDGRQYLKETTPQIEQLARDNNLLIVYGGSDDLCEFRGAIDDEFDCYEGGTITHKELLSSIEVIWCPKDVECSWSYKTDLPYSEFRIFEGDEVYCIGIVVDLNQQWGNMGKELNELDYIYAIRNKTTGNLQTARCHGSGKYYDNIGFAKRRCEEFNKCGYNSVDYNHEHGEFEVVRFELREVKLENTDLQ